MGAIMTSRQAAELDFAFERNGYTSKNVKKMSQGNILAELLPVLNGYAEVVWHRHIIDLSVPCKLPFADAKHVYVRAPKSGVVELERRGDRLYYDGKVIDLLLSEKQNSDDGIIGRELCEELETRGGNLGGNILDHLVVHPELWPESWKMDAQRKRIYVSFWGDIFCDPDGSLCVRGGYWEDNKVMTGYEWLSHDWVSNEPSASVTN